MIFDGITKQDYELLQYATPLIADVLECSLDFIGTNHIKDEICKLCVRHFDPNETIQGKPLWQKKKLYKIFDRSFFFFKQSIRMY